MAASNKKVAIKNCFFFECMWLKKSTLRPFFFSYLLFGDLLTVGYWISSPWMLKDLIYHHRNGSRLLWQTLSELNECRMQAQQSWLLWTGSEWRLCSGLGTRGFYCVTVVSPRWVAEMTKQRVPELWYLNKLDWKVSCPVCRRKVSTWGDRLQSASAAALLGREQQVQPRAETLE